MYTYRKWAKDRTSFFLKFLTLVCNDIERRSISIHIDFFLGHASLSLVLCARLNLLLAIFSTQLFRALKSQRIIIIIIIITIFNNDDDDGNSNIIVQYFSWSFCHI